MLGPVSSVLTILGVSTGGGGGFAGGFGGDMSTPGGRGTGVGILIPGGRVGPGTGGGVGGGGGVGVLVGVGIGVGVGVSVGVETWAGTGAVTCSTGASLRTSGRQASIRKTANGANHKSLLMLFTVTPPLHHVIKACSVTPARNTARCHIYCRPQSRPSRRPGARWYLTERGIA